MKMRLTRRRCGLACGLLFSWHALPAVTSADEPAALAMKIPTPPALIELEATAELSDNFDSPATERVRERHANRMLKCERTVAQDEMGNYYNHGPYTAWDEEGRMIGRGECRFDERVGKWTRWFSVDETETQFAAMVQLGFTAPFTSQAEFVEGRLHGTWTIVDARQRPVAAWEFEDGLRHGMSIWWSADGKKYREAEYLAGDLDGFVREFDAEEHVVQEDKFVGGYRLGVQVEYYETGELKSECEMVFAKNVVVAHDDWWTGSTEVSAGGRTGNDQRHGKYQAWDRAGNLILSGTYVDDRPDGKFTWSYGNGNKAIEGTYVAGKQDGLWTWWHENGLKEIVGEYAMGYEAGHWLQWTADGRVTETLRIQHDASFSGPITNELQPLTEPAVPTLAPAVADEAPASAEQLRRVNFEQFSFGDPEPTVLLSIERSEADAPVAAGPVLKVVPQRNGE